MSYRYTLEEILKFSNEKLSNFSVTSFVWNTMNEVGISFIKGMPCMNYIIFKLKCNKH